MFMERAKMISEGSISPTIKWKNLKNKTFSTKKEYQKRLTDIFLSFDDQIVKTRNQVEKLKSLK